MLYVKVGLYGVKKRVWNSCLSELKVLWKKLFIFILCILNVLPAWVYVYQVCGWCHWRSEKVVRFLGTGVTHSFKLPYGPWELSLCPLGQPVPLTTWTSFQPCVLYLGKGLIISVASLHMSFLNKETKIRNHFMEKFPKSRATGCM